VQEGEQRKTALMSVPGRGLGKNQMEVAPETAPSARVEMGDPAVSEGFRCPEGSRKERESRSKNKAGS
jgi:hypothetical protein